MSNNRNSVSKLNATDDYQNTGQLDRISKYKDKSVKSRAKSIYLGFIDQPQNQNSRVKKNRQSSVNFSRSSLKSNSSSYLQNRNNSSLNVNQYYVLQDKGQTNEDNDKSYEPSNLIKDSKE